MYERRSRLSKKQQEELLKLFVVGATARAASEVSEVNVKTATKFFMGLRQLIASKTPSYELSGEVEADESYFGGVRKGKRGRGAAGKVAMFGLLKRGGKVYTAIIPNAKTETLLPIILDVSEFHHRRINHSKLFADKHNHINGIENFWNQAKRPMRKFNGIKSEHFYWFLKKCEWRFNGGNHKSLLNQLKSCYKSTKH